MTFDPLSPSELILNDDGSIYHLNLLPSQIATTIITVGDPERVEAISKHFDNIECKIRHREFLTHTGAYKGKRMSVVSTGIGTDNIDIVFNELDALVNIDFETRKIKETHTQLEFIRVGTSGAIQEEIPLDSLLVSVKAIGFDNLLHYYKGDDFLDTEFSVALVEQLELSKSFSQPYVVSAHEDLLSRFSSEAFLRGITATNVGFYGPQGRTLRLATVHQNWISKLQQFRYRHERISNLEMETSAMYGMARLLGHKAISLNAILANRVSGEFSEDPKKSMNKLIETTLELLSV